MSQLLFLKLGGSLITDKTGVEVVREATLQRVAREIAAVLRTKPGLQLVLAHGSGSFGHVAASAAHTRQGVSTQEQWQGYARVSDAAARLNRRVLAALLDAVVPAVGLQPSASAVCEDGRIVDLAVKPIHMALAAGMVPVVYGDVAFDTVRGGTIISTEEVLIAVARTLRPTWFLLAGETDGVYDLQGRVIPDITAANFEEVSQAIGGSRGTDVTGGMASKVKAMLDLVDRFPGTQVRLFSGLRELELQKVLLDPQADCGTHIG